MVGNNTTIPVAGMSRTVMLINRSSELYPLLTRQRYTPPYSAQPSESLAGSLIVSVFCGPLMVSFSDLFWTLTSYNSPVCASRSSLYQVELTGVLSSDLAEHLKLISAASLCPIVSSTSLRAINSVFSETFAHTANRYSIPVLLILGRKCTQAVWTPHCYITLTTRRGQRNESRGSMVAPRVGQRTCDQKRSVRVGLPVGALLCKAPSTPATMSKQRSTLLPKTATMSNEICVEISSFRQSRTLLRHCCPKRQHCRRSNRQLCCLLLRQCCFDIVASVDRS